MRMMVGDSRTYCRARPTSPGAGLVAARDRQIRMYAAENGFVLVTKDEDSIG